MASTLPWINEEIDCWNILWCLSWIDNEIYVLYFDQIIFFYYAIAVWHIVRDHFVKWVFAIHSIFLIFFPFIIYTTNYPLPLINHHFVAPPTIIMTTPTPQLPPTITSATTTRYYDHISWTLCPLQSPIWPPPTTIMINAPTTVNHYFNHPWLPLYWL
jgi:hypothetical protein